MHVTQRAHAYVQVPAHSWLVALICFQSSYEISRPKEVIKTAQGAGVCQKLPYTHLSVQAFKLLCQIPGSAGWSSDVLAMEIENVLALAFDDASSCHMVIKEYCAKVCL